MDQNHLKKKAIEMLKNGKIKEAAETLLEAASDVPTTKLRIIRYLSNYNSLKREFNAGVLSQSKYLIEKNKIIRGLINCSKELSAESVKKRKKQKLILAIVLILLILVGSKAIYDINYPKCISGQVGVLVQIARFKNDTGGNFNDLLWRKLDMKIRNLELKDKINAEKSGILVDPGSTSQREQIATIENRYCNFSGLIVLGNIQLQPLDISSYLYASNLPSTVKIEEKEIQPIELKIPKKYKVEQNGLMQEKYSTDISNVIINLIASYEMLETPDRGSIAIDNMIKQLSRDTSQVPDLKHHIVVLYVLNDSIDKAISVLQNIATNDSASREIVHMNLNELLQIDEKPIATDSTSENVPRTIADPAKNSDIPLIVKEDIPNHPFATNSEEQPTEDKIDLKEEIPTDIKTVVTDDQDDTGGFEKEKVNDDTPVNQEKETLQLRKVSLRLPKGAYNSNIDTIKDYLTQIKLGLLKADESGIIDLSGYPYKDFAQELNQLPTETKQKIKELILVDCNIDVIDISLEDFKNLEKLDLSRNDFSNLPDEITKLPQLKELAVICNENLKVNWQAITSLSQLRYINFVGNKRAIQSEADKKALGSFIANNSQNDKNKEMNIQLDSRTPTKFKTDLVNYRMIKFINPKGGVGNIICN